MLHQTIASYMADGKDPQKAVGAPTDSTELGTTSEPISPSAANTTTIEPPTSRKSVDGRCLVDQVVAEFHDMQRRSPDMAVAVCAINALTSLIANSAASTMMGLERDLKDAAAKLQSVNPTAISLKAGCELFLRYVTRTSAPESDDFAAAKRRLIARGRQFGETSRAARSSIAELGCRFIGTGSTVLMHGYSRVAIALFAKAKAAGQHFRVVLTEGRPDETGIATAKALEHMGIPVTIVLDAGVAYMMEQVDIVLVGAEGIVENGGVINKLGTYGLAVLAKEANVPFYVAAESYKFARLYPLNQGDLPVESKPVDFGPLLPKHARVINPSRDYTPPQYISLLFTDLGVLTPAAVSDELIQLYS